MATINELWTIETMRDNDTARHMARTGVDLSHEWHASLTTKQIEWLGSIGLARVGEDQRAIYYRPAAQRQPGPVCFVADAPGRYGASDGRVWSAHHSIDEGRQALARSPGCVLHHGSLEPGTHWTSRMEQIYPEVK